MKVVHLGTSDGTNKPIEYWALQPNGLFEISKSEQQFANWYLPYMWLTEVKFI